MHQVQWCELAEAMGGQHIALLTEHLWSSKFLVHVYLMEVSYTAGARRVIDARALPSL